MIVLARTLRIGRRPPTRVIQTQAARFGDAKRALFDDMCASAALPLPATGNSPRRSSGPTRRSTTPLSRRPSCIGTRVLDRGRDDRARLALCAKRDRAVSARASDVRLRSEARALAKRLAGVVFGREPKLELAWADFLG